MDRFITPLLRACKLGTTKITSNRDSLALVVIVGDLMSCRRFISVKKFVSSPLHSVQDSLSRALGLHV